LNDAETLVEIPSKAVTRSVAERGRFFVGMSIAILATVFWGFSRSYYLKGYFGTRPLSPLVHLHGLILTSWVIVFAAQNALVAARRVGLHRRLGVAGALLAVAVSIVGPATSLVTGAERWARWFEAQPTWVATLAALIVDNTGNIVMFAVLVGAGLALRRRPDTHKRLMLLGTLALLDAPIARIFVDFGPLDFAARWLFAAGLFNFIVLPFYLALVIYDIRTLRRVHGATLWGGAVVFLLQFVFQIVRDHSDAAHALAAAGP